MSLRRSMPMAMPNMGGTRLMTPLHFSRDLRPKRRTKSSEEPAENEVGVPRMIMIEVGVARANIDHDRALLRIGEEGKMVTRKRMNLGARGTAIKAIAGDETKMITSGGRQ